MTIAEHPLDIDDSTPALVFSALGGFTCSICAPAAMTARQVESFVTPHLDHRPAGNGAPSTSHGSAWAENRPTHAMLPVEEKPAEPLVFG